MNEPTDNLSNDELLRLTSAQLDRDLDEEGQHRLAELLRGDREAQVRYLQHCQTHSMLAWEHGVLPVVEFDDAMAAGRQADVHQSTVNSARHWRQLAIAASALLVLSTACFLYQKATVTAHPITQKPGPQKTDFRETVPPLKRAPNTSSVTGPPWNSRDAVAVFAKNHGAKLRSIDADRILSVGDRVRTGDFELIGGFVELSFPNDIDLIIESPASFNVLSSSLMTLDRGSLSAIVGPAGEGFTVETPTANVVDFGTEFAIEVLDDRSSEVHVFKGEVHVDPKMAPPNTPLVRLLTDQATRIKGVGGIPEGIDVDAERFVRNLQEPETRSDSHGKLLRSMSPRALFRMGPSVDGRTLQNHGVNETAGVLHCENMISPPFAPGLVGRALSLGGPVSSAHVIVPNHEFAPEGKLTVCAWVRADSRPRWAAIAKHWAIEFDRQATSHTGTDYTGPGGQFHFGLHQDTGDLEIQIRDADRRVVALRENQPLPLGRWQHVAFVVDGSSLHLYRNGKRVATAPCNGLAMDGPSALGIGVKLNPAGNAPNKTNPGYWHGRIDELAIFHQALSEQQLNELYEIARPAI